MSLNAKAREFFRVIGEAASIVPALGYKMAEDDEKVSLGSLFEDTVSHHPDNSMLIFEDRQWTYSEFNLEVTRSITAGETALYIFTSGTTGASQGCAGQI